MNIQEMQNEIETLSLELKSYKSRNDQLNRSHIEHLQEIKELKESEKLLIIENLSILTAHKEIINTIQQAETHRQKGMVAISYLKALDVKIKNTYNKLIDKCSPLPF
jgi:predicted RNase H-like nuclease (RuvC/YqgF family)